MVFISIMNDRQKIEAILKVIEDKENERCPYCHRELHKFVHRDKIKYGCNHNDIHPEDIQVSKEDYLYEIENIIKWSQITQYNKYKKLNEF